MTTKLDARSICSFDDTDFAGAAGDTSAFESSSTTSFNRLDNSDDSKFYQEPRFVNHIDDAAIQALTSFYQTEFEESSSSLFDGNDETRRRPLDILDLCSSWTCHFPGEESSSFQYGRVVGLGMNEEELKANPLLTETIVHDLNQEPRLEQHFPDDSDACFDIITMAVSVDYLIQPLTVFQEIHRLLRPGTGKALISFSNRCFPTKAIATWLQADDLDRLTLVASYFHYSSQGWALLEALDLKDATQKVPARPSAKDIFANPALGLAWMNSAAAVQRTNAGDPMFVIKGVKT
jgi:SAM-dependent methyltransferase